MSWAAFASLLFSATSRIMHEPHGSVLFGEHGGAEVVSPGAGVDAEPSHCPRLPAPRFPGPVLSASFRINLETNLETFPVKTSIWVLEKQRYCERLQ